MGRGVAGRVAGDGSAEDQRRVEALAAGGLLDGRVDRGLERDDGGDVEAGGEPLDGVLVLGQLGRRSFGDVEAGVGAAAGVDPDEELVVGEVALFGAVAGGPGDDQDGHGDAEADAGGGQGRAGLGAVAGEVTPGQPHPDREAAAGRAEETQCGGGDHEDGEDGGGDARQDEEVPLVLRRVGPGRDRPRPGDEQGAAQQRRPSGRARPWGSPGESLGHGDAGHGPGGPPCRDRAARDGEDDAGADEPPRDRPPVDAVPGGALEGRRGDANQAARAPTLPRTEAVTPTAMPLATTTRRTWRGVAPRRREGPSWRRRR